MKRTICDISFYEIEVPDDMSDEDIIEGYNLGDIEGFEVDGRIELESV